MYWSVEYKRPAYRPVERGDWVCYAAEFYNRRIANYTSRVRGRGKNKWSLFQPFQYGEVLSSTKLTARVAWDDGTICSVLLCNLEPARHGFLEHTSDHYLEQLLDERIRLLTKANAEFRTAHLPGGLLPGES